MDPVSSMVSHMIRATIITHPLQVSDPEWGNFQLLNVYLIRHSKLRKQQCRESAIHGASMHGT